MILHEIMQLNPEYLNENCHFSCKNWLFLGLECHAHITIATELHSNQNMMSYYLLLVSYGVSVRNLRKISGGACWTPYINV
jgi:hypothetical protein